MRVPVALLVLALVVASCVGSESEAPELPSANPQATSTPTSAPTTTVAPTTTSLPTPTTTTAATTTIPEPELVLGHDGLGPVSFGEPVDEVMAVLTELLGPPDWEEFQISPDTDLSVRWGADGDELLYLQFTYWDYFDSAPTPPEPIPGGPVFHYYLTRSDRFATSPGIGVGSTVEQLKEGHPGVRFESMCENPNEFVIDPPPGWLNLEIWGLLDGDPNEPASRISHIGAGWDRTPC